MYSNMLCFIQLRDDTLCLFRSSSHIDDFVFEDFARLRLTGMKDEDDPVF